MRNSRSTRGMATAAAAALVLMIATAPATAAAESGTVVGTVTAADAGACLVITASSVDFGTNPFSSSQSAPVIEGVFDGGPATRFGIQNCGAVDQRLLASGTDATSQTSAAAWTLGGSAEGVCTTPDVYKLYHFIDTTGGGTDSADIVPTTSELPWTLAPAAELTSGLWMVMPCSGSSGAGEAFDFQVVYTGVTA